MRGSLRAMLWREKLHHVLIEALLLKSMELNQEATI